MTKNKPWTVREALIALFAIAFVLLVYGAIPFLMIPTLGQAVWSMGFSQSFANGPFLNFYANEFGIPNPAAIAFGLAGAWPASLLIRLGFHPADAYAGMICLWLGLAMLSAYKIARGFGANRSIALLGGIAWLTMPIVWLHAAYSMLSIGIALLSFYFWAALKLFLVQSKSTRVAPSSIAIYILASIISVFMDGYTFVMFGTGATIFLLYSLVTRPESRPLLSKISIPVHILSFILAYALFSAYIGKSNFDAHPIDFFRGWGLDLSFLILPTKNLFWLPDFLGISLVRSNGVYFGNAPVWETTFALPVIALGLFSWWRIRGVTKIATGVFFVTIFGFYMALGPSLKINSTKPESLQISLPREQGSLMHAELAIVPTGNAWISQMLPGFNVMRAAYRWTALGIFGLWLLIMLAASSADKKKQRFWLLGLLVIVLFNFPDLQNKFQRGTDNRDMLLQIDSDLISELQRYIKSKETVAFVPWGNDVLVNYLAPRLGIKSFNIGGDKNLQAAQLGWPSTMLFASGEIDFRKAKTSIKMLIDGSTDMIILPYFNIRYPAEIWPCPDQATAKLTGDEFEQLRLNPDYICPESRRAELQSVINQLRYVPYVEVTDAKLFATVRLRDEFSGVADRLALQSKIFNSIQYPIVIEKFELTSYVLREGWHEIEAHHVWSNSDAKLMLPIPKDCEYKECEAKLVFGVFGANLERTKSVLFNSAEQGWEWSEQINAFSGDAIELNVPLTGGLGSRSISISIPTASSPQNLFGIPDSRILGISLQRIELVKP